LGALKDMGAFTYEMGRVHVRDRTRLEGAACECYAIIVREFDRLLDGPQAAAHRELANPLAGVTTSEGDRTMLGDGTPRRPEDEEASAPESPEEQ
jgi:hypothetical protein